MLISKLLGLLLMTVSVSTTSKSVVTSLLVRLYSKSLVVVSVGEGLRGLAVLRVMVPLSTVFDFLVIVSVL